MTRAETIAFNAGLAAVGGLAARSAEEMRQRILRKPTRYPFAAEAFQAIADEASAMALPVPLALPDNK